MSWTEADGDALFRQPPGDPADEEKKGAFHGGPEAMRRLRFPFEADSAETAEQRETTKPDAGE